MGRWANSRAIFSTLEIIYSKKVHSSDGLSQYACLATQNILRSRHDSGDSLYALYEWEESNFFSGEIMTRTIYAQERFTMNSDLRSSAQEHADWLERTGEFKHVNERTDRSNTYG